MQLDDYLVSLPQTPTVNIPALSKMPCTLLLDPEVRGWYREISISGFSHFVIPVDHPVYVSGSPLHIDSTIVVMLKFALTFCFSAVLEPRMCPGVQVIL